MLEFLKSNIAIVIYLPIFFIVLFYYLYINGHMDINCKSATIFIGQKYKNKRITSVNSCNGYIKFVLKFKESRTYSFENEIQLIQGAINIEILDKNKNVILSVNNENTTKTLMIDKSKRYYMKINYVRATGKHVLRWI